MPALISKTTLLSLGVSSNTQSCFGTDNTIFRIFLVKCKRSYNDRTHCGITLSELEIIE